LLTQFLGVAIACAQASKAGVTRHDWCVASRSSSGHSEAGPRKGVLLASTGPALPSKSKITIPEILPVTTAQTRESSFHQRVNSSRQGG
jgi:hypothetical protein